MDTTHDGPPLNVTAQLWSDYCAPRAIQETPHSRLQVGEEMSDKSLFGVSSTLEVNCLLMHV
jgi:hypothetical protein